MATIKSVSTIIDLAKKSQYLALVDIANGGLFGGGVDVRLPQKIYWNRKSVERVQSLDGIYSEVRATATITIDAIGSTGVTYEVLVNDPELGAISLGTYTQVGGDTTTAILAASIRAELANNAYDYDISVDDSVITITAPEGYGATINGDDRLSVEASEVAETKAVANYNCASLAGLAEGTLLSIEIEYPASTYTQIATYTTQAGDNVAATLCGRLVMAITGNVQGYTASDQGSGILRVTAATGQGANINGNDLFFSWNSGGNSSSTTFSGGVNGSDGIQSTLTQFAGGVTASTGDTNLRKCANYLYWLCGGYALTAQGISGEGGVAPIVANFDLPAPYDFTVTNTSFIIAGQQSKSITNFIGYNILFIRGGVPQSQNDQGDGTSYFTWNSNTGLFNMYPEASLGEPLLLYAQI